MKFTVQHDWYIEIQDEDGNVLPVTDEDGNLITYDNAYDAQHQYQEANPDSTFIGPKRWPEKS